MYCPFPYIFVGACIINGRGNMANMPDKMLRTRINILYEL